jgi:two-component system, NarL family, sensor histidine kinase UhpB
MWKKRSLQFRLNALFALVLILGLAINVGRLMLEAGPRVQAEDESVVRLAREFVETLVGDLKESPDPDAKLARIVDSLSRLRHVSITHRRDATESEVAPTGNADPQANDEAPPEWFVALVRPEQTRVSVPISLEGRSLGSLMIASHPADEIAEIWDGIVLQLEVGSALAVALFLITVIVVNRALSPVQQLADAMVNIEAGHYGTRVAVGGSAEIATICDKLNNLAFALGEAVEDKRRLAERLVSLQDIERKEVARELHDEFGPHLFALRAHATSLRRMAEGAEPDTDGLRKHGSAMLDQINVLQQFNRRILEKLRPVGLSELGLDAALDAVMQLWRDTHPGVVIETTISPSLGALGETAELTIYRVVQEALTNVFRHSGATSVSVLIEAANEASRSPSDGSNAIRVRIQDSGDGLPDSLKPGYGMIGMRERVLALGGTLNVISTGTGVTVEAIVPNGSGS